MKNIEIYVILFAIIFSVSSVAYVLDLITDEKLYNKSNEIIQEEPIVTNQQPLYIITAHKEE